MLTDEQLRAGLGAAFHGVAGQISGDSMNAAPIFRAGRRIRRRRRVLAATLGSAMVAGSVGVTLTGALTGAGILGSAGTAAHPAVRSRPPAGRPAGTPGLRLVDFAVPGSGAHAVVAVPSAVTKSFGIACLPGGLPIPQAVTEKLSSRRGGGSRCFAPLFYAGVTPTIPAGSRPVTIGKRQGRLVSTPGGHIDLYLTGIGPGGHRNGAPTIGMAVGTSGMRDDEVVAAARRLIMRWPAADLGRVMARRPG